MVTNNYLFVYGTLLNEANEFGSFLKNNCSFYAAGKFKGLLYDIGEYPGAVLANTENYVFGSICLLNNADAVLERLDDYEGFGPTQEQPNLFVRELIMAETGNETVTCWCYLYNLPVHNLKLIASGNYLQYKSRYSDF